jgi:hypothetical protein
MSIDGEVNVARNLATAVRRPQNVESRMPKFGCVRNVHGNAKPAAFDPVASGVVKAI